MNDLGMSKYLKVDGDDMSKTVLKIEGMMCEGCVKSVREALENLSCTFSVDFYLKKGTATV